MDITTAPAAFGPLDVLYIEDVSDTTVKIVCAPEMRATQAELTAAMKDIKERKGVFDVRQGGTEGNSFAITVQFDQYAGNVDDKKKLLFEQLAPKYVLGQAWGNVIRKGDGKHLSTFLRIDVARWAAAPVMEQLGNVTEVAQFSTKDDYVSHQRVVGIGFTMKRPTRDRVLNQVTVVDVAKQLGIMLADESFTIKDDLAYASIPECNRDGDPIDARPGDAA